MARAKPKNEKPPILQELEAIKRLLVAALARDGLTQEQIAKVLQVSQPSVSRMLPPGIGPAKGRRQK